MDLKIKTMIIKLIVFFALVWFFAIPTMEMSISNISDAYKNKITYEKNIVNENKYENLSIHDKTELLWDLINSEQSSSFAIADPNQMNINHIDLNAIKKDGISKNIEALSFLFIYDYKMKIMPPFYSDSKYTYQSENYKKIDHNINRENIKKIRGVLKNKDVLNIMDKIDRKRKRTKYFFELDSHKYKIHIDNKELIELIAVIGYEINNQNRIVKIQYGFTFLVSFILMFTIFVVLMEQYLINYKKFPKCFIKRLRIIGKSDYDYMLMLNFIKNVFIVIISAGFFNISLNLYLKELSQVGELEFWNLFFEPMIWLGYGFGYLYTSGLPLSRFVLFLVMPIALSIYWFLISNRSKIK